MISMWICIQKYARKLYMYSKFLIFFLVCCLFTVQCFTVPHSKVEGKCYLSLWNKIEKLVLIEYSDGNGPACHHPPCSKKPSALTPHDTNLVAAGHLSNSDSSKQWQMCLSAAEIGSIWSSHLLFCWGQSAGVNIKMERASLLQNSKSVFPPLLWSVLCFSSFSSTSRVIMLMW